MMRKGMELKIGGIIPPVLTAFDKNGDFDEKAQREIVSFLIDKVQGLYPCGTYGSGPLMEVQERKRVAEVIIDEVAGRIPVIVHVGGASTRSVIELAKHAEKAGATAVAAVPPIYYGFKEPEVERHFKALIDAVSIPIFVYNNPKTTGVSISADFLDHLAQIGVAGVKDSSFDIMVFYSYLRKVKEENFIPIIGTEALILPAVVMGAHGAVSGLANAFPEPVVELFNLVKNGDIKKAQALQSKVSAMRDIMHYGPAIPMIQAILHQRGVNAGYPRLPFILPDKELLNRALTDFKKMGIPL
jgi:dihydrodipicolinate synthase/N-acetylneuraminate lyase